MSSVDLGRYLRSVALDLRGEPNKALSSKTELRFGANGSLSVDLDKGTWFDHETKEGGGTLDFIARETGRKNGEAVDWLREQGFDVGDDHAKTDAKYAEKYSTPPAKAKIVATYDYVDEAGELVFQVCRFEPKTFRQRRKPMPGDEPGKIRDGWVWSVKGIRQVPYRLPDLLEAVSLEKPIFVVEGEKDVENLARLGITATCNAMGAGKWPEGLGDHFRGADVIHLSDNDDAGREHTGIVAAALKEIAGRQRVLDLPGLPAKGDVSDWIAAGGTADQLWALVEARARPWTGERPKLNFGAVWFADTDRAMEEPEWLIDDLLTRGDLSLVYGASGSGKSFFTTHLAMAVVRGDEVLGHKVLKPGGVVYIAAEGRKGYKKRLRAYRKHHGIPDGTPLPFVFLPVAIDLFANGEGSDGDKLIADLKVLAAEMQAMGTRLELVVIDTHAAVSPGANENASEDGSRMLRRYQVIQEVTGAHVMVVHHKNAAGEKPRGWTGIFANVDNAVEVDCDEYKNRTAKIAKMKDGEDGLKLGFRLQSVEIGARDDGKTITSCVVVPAQAAERRTGKGPILSDQHRIALQALREAVLSRGEAPPPGMDIPYGIKVVRVGDWKREFLKRAFTDGEPNESTFRMAFKRAFEGLQSRSVIGASSPFVWIAREPSS